MPKKSRIALVPLERITHSILELRGQNIKYLPYAFTEHRAIQAANVLSSPRAVTMGIYVVRAFVELREVLASKKDLATQARNAGTFARGARPQDSAAVQGGP